MANKYQGYAQVAQDKRRWWFDCQNKTAYDDYNQAHDGYWEVYHCPYCDKYHRRTPLAYKVNKMVRKLKKRRRK